MLGLGVDVDGLSMTDRDASGQRGSVWCNVGYVKKNMWANWIVHRPVHKTATALSFTGRPRCWILFFLILQELHDCCSLHISLDSGPLWQSSPSSLWTFQVWKLKWEKFHYWAKILHCMFEKLNNYTFKTLCRKYVFYCSILFVFKRQDFQTSRSDTWKLDEKPQSANTLHCVIAVCYY